MYTGGELMILIVDDAELVSARLGEMLFELPFVKKINIASNYQQAVTSIAAEEPHLLLLDLQLPETNGIKLLRYVNKNYPFIKNIIVTNQVDSAYKSICQEVGCDHFIDKSKDIDSIAEIVKTYYN